MVIRRCSHGPKDSNIRRTAGLRARSRAVCPKQSWRLPSALCKRNRICTQFSCPAAELRCRAGERPIENNCSRWVVNNWKYRVGFFASVSKRGLIILFPRIYSLQNQRDRGNLNEERNKQRGSRDGAVVIALDSHQCGPGSNPRPGVISGLSLLLVLVLAQRVFLRVLRFSSLHKINISKFQFDREFGGHGFVSRMTVMSYPRKNKVENKVDFKGN